MNTDIELSIAATYVPDWGVVEAIRELVQNAVDQETTNNSTMVLNYDWETEELRVTSKGSKLGRASLLLGHTTKACNAETIGNFGEGYKLALMVLSRLRYTVEVENFGAQELWSPTIVKSPAFATDVLSINISKLMCVMDHTDLVFKISGMTKEIMDKVLESNLHFTDYPKHIETGLGSILTDESMKGKLFVSGLFVQHVPELHYGYDFHADRIELDRDRRMIATFELTWLISRLWSDTSESKLINAMLKDGAMDTKHYSSHSNSNGGTAKLVYDEFIAEHGTNAVPVVHQSDIAEMKALGRKPIVCKEAHADVVNSVLQFEHPVISVVQKQPAEFLEELLDRPGGVVVPDAYTKLRDLVNVAEEWSL